MMIKNISYLSQIITEHCFLFVIYLILNIFDYITGSMNAYVNKTESSLIGQKGIIKKLCSWILLFVSFILPLGFDELGSIIDIDFQITELLGWLTLVSLIINEVRSILENFVSIGCRIPSFLTNGLEVVNRKLNEGKGDKIDELNN